MRIGINGNLTEQTVPFIKDLGTTLYREGLVWSEVETKPKKYDWTKPDLIANLCRTNGWMWIPTIIGPLGDCWQFEKWPGLKNDMASLLELDSWERFIRVAIDRYNDVVWAWEIWQSPNCGSSGWFPYQDLGTYVTFCKILSGWIKNQGGPDTCVMSASCDPEVALAAFEEMFHYGLLEIPYQPDYIGLQFYYNNESCTPRIFNTLTRDIKILRDMMRERCGKVVPLVMTETGWPVGKEELAGGSRNYIDGVFKVSEQTACHRLERILHYGDILDLAAVCIHTVCDGTREGIWGDCCGLLDADMKQRMGFYGVKDFVANYDQNL